jgi:hypothetical protein
MTRYDDLRKMREAKFQAKAAKPKASVTPVTNNNATDNISVTPVTPKRGRGRPKTGKAMSAKERMLLMRARRRAEKTINEIRGPIMNQDQPGACRMTKEQARVMIREMDLETAKCSVPIIEPSAAALRMRRYRARKEAARARKPS